MMKKHIFWLVVIGVATLASYSSANAQSEPLVTAKIPFDFYAGGKEMAAGTYVIEKASSASGPMILALVRKESGEKIFVTAFPVDVAVRNSASLLFDREGDTYYLSEIRGPVSGLGARLAGERPPSDLAQKCSASGREIASLRSR